MNANLLKKPFIKILMSNSNDLLFYANVQHDIQREAQTIEFLKEFVHANPKLNKSERSNFLLLYKAAIDKSRKNVRTLLEAYENEKENGNAEISDKIFEYKEKALNELRETCNDVLSVLNDLLLPNAEDTQARVFYFKFMGDLHRYKSEYTYKDEKESATAEAEKAYTQAYTLSEELSKNDPIRLGTILNYAVFKFENQNNAEEAIEMVQNALESVSSDFSDLSENSHTESIGIIGVMTTNLTSWNEPEEEEILEIRPATPDTTVESKEEETNNNRNP